MVLVKDWLGMLIVGGECFENYTGDIELSNIFMKTSTVMLTRPIKAPVACIF